MPPLLKHLRIPGSEGNYTKRKSIFRNKSNFTIIPNKFSGLKTNNTNQSLNLIRPSQKTHKNTLNKLKPRNIPSRNSQSISKYSFKKKDYDIHTLKDHHIVFSSKREKINFKLKKRYNPYYYVSPLELNTVLLQYLVDNNLLTYDEKGLGIKDFPSLVVEEHNQSKFSKEDSHFVEVCEKEHNPEIDLCDPFDRNVHYQNLYGINPLLPPGKRIYDCEFRTPGYIKETDQPAVLVNDVFYVTQLIRKLRDFERKKVRNDGLKVIEDKEGKGIEKDECDLKFSEYDIIEEMGFIEGVGDVVIVGYPDTDDMGHFLNNKDFMQYFRETYKVHENYDKLLVGLYNAFEKDENKISDSLDFFKLKKLSIFKELIDNMKILLKNEFGDLDGKYYQQFLSAIDEIVNEIFKDYFKYSNIRISYIFHHFIKIVKDDGSIDFEPMVYSIRELTNKHISVLSRTLDLIEIELPQKFQFNLNKEGRFPHFFSYHRHGDIFYIRTDKIDDLDLFSHTYERSISLEELIYSCDIPHHIEFWKKLQFEYKLKNNRVLKSDGRVITKSIEKSIKKENNKKVDTKKKNNVNKNSKKLLNFLKAATIIKCNLLQTKEVEIYYQKIINGVIKFFYVKLKPKLRYIDISKISEFFNSTKNLPIYNCGTKKVKSLEIENYQLYNDQEQIQITNQIKNPFTKIVFTFPIVKQSFQNFIFLDTFLKKISNGKKNYSNYHSYFVYNLFYSKNFSREITVFSDENKLCDIQICNQIERDTLKIYGKKGVLIDGIIYYVLIFQKIPFEKSFKYVVWVYQTDHCKTTNLEEIKILLDGNKIRSIFDLKGEHLKFIIKEIEKFKELFEINPDEQKYPYYPSFNNIIINKMSSLRSETFHIQILPKIEIYYSNIYDTNMTLATEQREETLSNISNKINIYPRYYNDMIKKGMTFFNIFSFATL